MPASIESLPETCQTDCQLVQLCRLGKLARTPSFEADCQGPDRAILAPGFPVIEVATDLHASDTMLIVTTASDETERPFCSNQGVVESVKQLFKTATERNQ